MAQDDASTLVADLEACGPAGSECQQTLHRLTHVLECTQLGWQVTSVVLSKGLVLTMALGRCALAEAERDVRYWDYWAQVVESAREIMAAWERLKTFCQNTETEPGQIIRPCPAREVVEVTVRMAQATMQREERLSPRGNEPSQASPTQRQG